MPVELELTACLLKCAFEFQQGGFAVQAAGIARERAVGAQHAVAGHDDADRVAPDRRAHGAHRAGLPMFWLTWP
jgi:hypothetical protein